MFSFRLLITILVRGTHAAAAPPCPNNTVVDANGYLSVKLFGALGDAVHDDAPALQKAVNAAQSSGRTLRLPAGVYLGNSTVVVAADEPLKKGSPACSASTPALPPATTRAASLARPWRAAFSTTSGPIPAPGKTAMLKSKRHSFIGKT